MLAEAEKRNARRYSEKVSLQKVPLPLFIQGNAEKLPFEDQTFDAVTVAFGVRNFAHRLDAFRQIYRVLKPGGSLLILDFATPGNRIWNFFYGIYFSYIVPLLGRIFSGNRNAYRYLFESVANFPQYQALCNELTQTNFTKVHYHAYTGGVAVLYICMRTFDQSGMHTSDQSGMRTSDQTRMHTSDQTRMRTSDQIGMHTRS